jgi:hypothetical protein
MCCLVVASSCLQILRNGLVLDRTLHFVLKSKRLKDYEQ